MPSIVQKKNRTSSTAPQYQLLAVFIAFLALVYGLVFFTGDGKPEPKLGIDLKGGTRITLSPEGSPSKSDLETAQQILLNRVNGMGVGGSQVIIDGDNLVVTIPAGDAGQARNLGSTAKLSMRMVNPATNSLQGQGQSVDAQPIVKVKPGESPAQTRKREVAALRAFRQGAKDQSEEQRVATLVENAAKFDCNVPDRFAGADDPALPLLACDAAGVKYILDPSPLVRPDDKGSPRFDGSYIDSKQVGSGLNEQNKFAVNLTFVGDGIDAWARMTREASTTGGSIAMVLDSQVASAATAASPILNGKTEITGSFGDDESKTLANNLRYGALPLQFASEDGTPGGKIETVPASLGVASLRAGLIAGAIGLIAVFIFALAYYRALGVITIFALISAGLLTYGSIVLLGRWIGYTLDLAGIAGLIIGIGMTADSFVVFFERIKDEIREGRSFRSAVPRGWKSARRTIWTGNAVSFLASAILYFVAIGEVRGFAFTLGLTTVFDIVIVFVFTAPLVLLLSQTKFMAKPLYNGLGSLERITEERRQAVKDIASKQPADKKEAH